MDNNDLAKKVRLFDYKSKIKYHNEINGVNSCMDEVQVEILNVDLKFMADETIERKHQHNGEESENK